MRGETAMGKVTSDISVSLDGFVTGPNGRVGNGMGAGGDRLHDWRFAAKTESDLAKVDEIHASTGAVLIGKSMFDLGFEPWATLRPTGCRCS
jgi:dihydrofolate reductase